MPLIIGELDVFPDGREPLRAVFEGAARECAAGVTWTVSAYEAVELAGTRVTLDGPRRLMIWAPWTQEQPGRFSMVVMRDGVRWREELTDAIRLMISRDMPQPDDTLVIARANGRASVRKLTVDQGWIMLRDDVHDIRTAWEIARARLEPDGTAVWYRGDDELDDAIRPYQ